MNRAAFLLNPVVKLTKCCAGIKQGWLDAVQREHLALDPTAGSQHTHMGPTGAHRDHRHDSSELRGRKRIAGLTAVNTV